MISPISDNISNAETIYFIPYEILHFIPIHALLLDDQPLIKKCSVAYIPHASLLQLYRPKNNRSKNDCVSFGVDFIDEAKDIAKLFDSCALTNVTKEVVLKNLDADIIHFSCHGYFNPQDPLLSGIRLIDNEFLSAKDVLNLQLNAKLVTVSACQSGINLPTGGDDLVGLMRAFLYAGAKSIVLSFWSVEAISTHELMIDFYTLLKKGEKKANALRKAQLNLMAKKEYSHPYFWAPFRLIGDIE